MGSSMTAQVLVMVINPALLTHFSTLCNRISNDSNRRDTAIGFFTHSANTECFHSKIALFISAGIWITSMLQPAQMHFLSP